MEEKKLECEFYEKPPQLGAWKSFQVFMWNAESKEFMGRTGTSWAKIGIFYVIFYLCLAAMVALFMWLFLLTINPKYPKWQLEQSLIGHTPGLGFRPMPYQNLDSTLIWFKGSNRGNFQPWVDSLDSFLDGYYTRGKILASGGKVKNCSHTNYPQDQDVCNVNVYDWGKCNRNDYYEYHKSSPCIFLKLNRVYQWIPDFYLNEYEFPADMPKQLRNHIKSINNTIERQNVWISCDGEGPSDKENIGPITYHPKVQGFPGYFFPYLNREGYLSPLVAVKFERPAHGVLINIECRVWAKNIKYDRKDRIGSVHFELLVD